MPLLHFFLTLELCPDPVLPNVQRIRSDVRFAFYALLDLRKQLLFLSCAIVVCSCVVCSRSCSSVVCSRSCGYLTCRCVGCRCVVCSCVVCSRSCSYLTCSFLGCSYHLAHGVVLRVAWQPRLADVAAAGAHRHANLLRVAEDTSEKLIRNPLAPAGGRYLRVVQVQHLEASSTHAAGCCCC